MVTISVIIGMLFMVSTAHQALGATVVTNQYTSQFDGNCMKCVT